MDFSQRATSSEARDLRDCCQYTISSERRGWEILVNISPRAKREAWGIFVNLSQRAKREVEGILVNLPPRGKREAQRIFCPFLALLRKLIFSLGAENSQTLKKIQKFCRDTKFFLWLIFIVEIEIWVQNRWRLFNQICSEFLSRHFEFS